MYQRVRACLALDSEPAEADARILGHAPEPPPLLSTPDWRRATDPARRIGHSVEFHAELTSTNDAARAALAERGADGRAVVADLQTAGRGRQGRSWASPAGVNLMVSVGLRPALAAADGWKLAFAAALAACRACEPWLRPHVKWPNDIVSVDGLKLGGILVETAVESSDLAEAVIGLGLNVNWRRADMPTAIRERATSIAEVAGRPVDRVTVLGRYLTALDVEVAAIERGESPAARVAERSWLDGRVVRVELDGREIEGRVVGIDAGGALVVETPAGVRTVTHGDAVHVAPGREAAA